MKLSLCLLPVVSVICATAIGQSQLHRFPADVNTYSLGSDVASADVDGDGFDDVIAGARYGSTDGAVRVFSGRDGEILYTIYGSIASGSFGTSVAGLSDLNGDGREDFIVGTLFHDTPGTDSGAAHVFSGVDGSLLRQHVTPAKDDEFGVAVAGLGDIDGDGIGDYVVGARTGSNPAGSHLQGSATIFSGQTGAELQVYYGDSQGDNLGRAVADAGDVNDDGVADILVGAPYDDYGWMKSEVGRVWVYSGEWLRSTLLGIPPATPQVLHKIWGVNASDSFGTSVSGAGDIDGDGHDDFIVGAQGYPEMGIRKGYARIHSGKDGSLLYHHATGVEADKFGYRVSGGHDVNGDGWPDYAVSAEDDDTAYTLAGAVMVFSGLDASLIGTVFGADKADRLGASLCIAGDVNNDGLADIVSGSSSGGPGLYGDGLVAVHTLSGAASTFGIGCGGVPSIGWQGAPDFGATDFTITLRDARPNSTGFLVLGLSSSTWGPFPLPLDMTGLGADGCDLLVAANLLLPAFTDSDGNAFSPMPIPADPSLVGLSFYTQFAVFDPPANPLGYSLSDGLLVVVQ